MIFWFLCRNLGSGNPLGANARRPTPGFDVS
jgi:hypothetical protein